MKKNCLITHKADLDGAFPIVLMNLIFKDTDVYSCEISDVDSILKEVLKQEENYDNIFITDLCIGKEFAEEIDKNEKLKEKIKILDHHESQIELNKYSFIQVTVQTENKKDCGTTLFLKYLQKYYDKPVLHKKSLLQITELIRQLDTYDFTEDKKESAFYLGSLYSIYGREQFIQNLTDFILKNEEFYFSETELLLIKIEKERVNRYIEEKLQNMKKATIKGIPVGIVFAEQNRSALGHEMAIQNPDIDIAIVINIDRSVSYRADKDEVNINILAIPQGGGGHKHAGGSPLPINIQEEICKQIFQGIEFK